MRIGNLVIAAATLTACSPVLLQVPMEPADVEMARNALEQGTGSINGSALLRLRDGDVVTCAGNEVILIPATESASEGLREFFGDESGYISRGGHAPPYDDGTIVVAPEPNRRTRCDAQGFFTFDNVRTGKWHIITTVVWTSSGYRGGTLLTTTAVTDGDEVKVVLTHQGFFTRGASAAR